MGDEGLWDAKKGVSNFLFEPEKFHIGLHFPGGRVTIPGSLRLAGERRQCESA